MSFEWMAWTAPTAVFVLAVFTLIGTMTFVSIRWPSSKTKGFLPLETTRGERLYIGLITSGLLLLLWLGVTDMTLWIMVAVCLAWVASVMRWG